MDKTAIGIEKCNENGDEQIETCNDHKNKNALNYLTLIVSGELLFQFSIWIYGRILE